MPSLNRVSLRKEVESVYNECALVEWKGCGEDPIKCSNYQDALKFVDLIPKGIPTPEVCADTNGCISFEWYKSPYKSLCITASRDAVCYAYYIGEDEEYGQFQLGSCTAELQSRLKAIFEKRKKK